MFDSLKVNDKILVDFHVFCYGCVVTILIKESDFCYLKKIDGV